MNKKAELVSALTLAAVFILGFSFLILIDQQPSITGMAVAGGPAGASLSACGTINESSVLTQNIMASAGTTCLNITADNIILDCQNFFIIGNGAGNGIEVQSRKNVTIRNCIITNFTGTADVEAMNGIFFKKSNDSMIINSTIYGNRMGIQLFDNSQGNKIEGCNISNNLQYQGVYIYSSSGYNVVNDSDIGFNGGHGVKITTSSYVNLTNNRIYDNSNNGIEYLGPVSTTHKMIQNYIYSNAQWGIHIDSQTSNMLYENNTASNNGNGDIKIDGTSTHTFLDQIFSGYNLNVSSGLIFENTNQAKLSYLQAVTATGTNLANDIGLDNSFVYVNGTNTALNKSANITFYGLNYGSINDVKVIYDPEDDGVFTDCPSGVCTKLNYSSGALTFNVTGFTNYSITNSSEILQCGLSITQSSSLYHNLSNCDGFTIGADNIVFDCRGYSMMGNGSGIGLFIAYNRSNVTIKDCVIKNFTTGIVASYSINSSYFIGNTITNSSNGLVLGVSSPGGQSNIIANNTFSGIPQVAVDLRAYGTNLTNNNFSSNLIGLRVLGSSGNLVENNYFDSNSQAGLSLHTSNNTIRNATFSSNTMDVLMLVNGLQNNSFIDSTIGPYNISSCRFSLEDTAAGRIEFLNDSTGAGTSLVGSSNSDIRIINNTLFVNVTSHPGFNVSARLSHYSLQNNQNDSFWDQEDDGSFVRCQNDVCTNKNFVGNTLNYEVSHFTTFKADSNHIPNVTIPFFSPIPVYTSTNLTVSVNYTDIDDDNGTIYFNWTVDGTPVKYINYTLVSPNNGTANDNLSSGNFSKGQNITVYVQGYDGYNYSTIQSSSIIVSNTPPADPTINVTPISPNETQDIYCNITVNATDIDSDSISYYYFWYNNSVLFQTIGLTSQTYDTLILNYTHQGDIWNCTVLPFDGQDNGTSASLAVTIQDTTPPNSTITTLTNNSDIGKNSFPINISGTAGDNINVGYVQVNINGTFYNATGTTSWNYSWTPAIDGEYQVYSLAVDSSGNNETQLENYTLEIYATSNITNSTKINSINLNSDILNSVETDSDINISVIDLSEFLNVTSQNCRINNSDLNHSTCENSLITDCIGTGWYVDPSNITNVTGNNNNFTNSNVSHSTVDDSNVSDSTVTLSNITLSSVVNGSHITNSNITNSQVDYSNVTDSDINDSTIDNSNITDTFVDNSIVNSSTIKDSNITNSTLIEVNITNSNVSNSGLNNVTLIDSNVQNMDLNNTIIANDQCTAGTIIYQGTTYICSASSPINLNNIYSPPSASSSGGGGSRRIYECSDNIDNDYDNLIDYPEDPGCTSRYDAEETNGAVCLESWICTDWSGCFNSQQSRICTDEAFCQEKLKTGEIKIVINRTKPVEEQGCVTLTSPIEVECHLNEDCQEGYQCQDNTCLLVPEREPAVPEIGYQEKLIAFFSKITSFAKKILSSIKSTVLHTFNSIKSHYGPVIITVLVVALLIAGYFAYHSFVSAGYLERIKKIQKQKQKIRSEKIKIQEKQDLSEVSQQLTYFIRDSFFAGYSASEIKQALASKGWTKNVIDLYTSKIYQINQDAIAQLRKTRKVQQELKRLNQEIRSPQQGIKFYQKPEIKDQPKLKLFTLEPKPVKETRASRLLKAELNELQEEIEETTIPEYQKPKSSLKKSMASETSLEQLQKTISQLSKEGKSKEQIISLLVKKDWPEDFVHKYIRKNFPQIEHISFFKKEVAELEETLKNLKRGDKKWP